MLLEIFYTFANFIIRSDIKVVMNFIMMLRENAIVVVGTDDDSNCKSDDDN